MAFALTSAAKSDLKAIARFTEKRWGRVQRNLYIKQFDDSLSSFVFFTKIWMLISNSRIANATLLTRMFHQTNFNRKQICPID